MCWFYYKHTWRCIQIMLPSDEVLQSSRFLNLPGSFGKRCHVSTKITVGELKLSLEKVPAGGVGLFRYRGGAECWRELFRGALAAAIRRH